MLRRDRNSELYDSISSDCSERFVMRDYDRLCRRIRMHKRESDPLFKEWLSDKCELIVVFVEEHPHLSHYFSVQLHALRAMSEQGEMNLEELNTWFNKNMGRAMFRVQLMQNHKPREGAASRKLMRHLSKLRSALVRPETYGEKRGTNAAKDHGFTPEEVKEMISLLNHVEMDIAEGRTMELGKMREFFRIQASLARRLNPDGKWGTEALEVIRPIRKAIMKLGLLEPQKN